VNKPLLEVNHLKKYFNVKNGLLHAVDDVTFTIDKGKTLGVVGESGCGKSTLGRVILRLIDATDGEICFKDENILKYDKETMRRLRSKMQLIFQDPYSSINPRMTVSDIIAEPLYVNKLCRTRAEMDKKVKEYMETVGLASRLAYAYPHELDGGRRQRIGIARALILEPEFIVCDEPVSALDVSIQAQILNLLKELQERFDLTYMFITHNLAVVKHISDDIAVMYLGKLVEKANTDELFSNPIHPYTQALLHAIPHPNLKYRDKKLDVIVGEVKSPINPKMGCRFASRCQYVMDRCKQENPELLEVSPGHFVSCFKCC